MTVDYILVWELRTVELSIQSEDSKSCLFKLGRKSQFLLLLCVCNKIKYGNNPFVLFPPRRNFWHKQKLVQISDRQVEMVNFIKHFFGGESIYE